MRGTDLKFSSVILRDSEGEQRFDAARLPLRLGTGTDCEIRLPGPGSSAVALLDELDGEPFVQPVGRGSNVTINGEPLVASRKLSVDDELGFFGSRIVIGQIDDAMLLNVRLEDSGNRVIAGRPGWVPRSVYCSFSPGSCLLRSRYSSMCNREIRSTFLSPVAGSTCHLVIA